MARINAELWADLFLSNRAELSDELVELIRNIESIREAVDCGDREKIVALLSAAREKRRNSDNGHYDFHR